MGWYITGLVNLLKEICGGLLSTCHNFRDLSYGVIDLSRNLPHSMVEKNKERDKLAFATIKDTDFKSSLDKMMEVLNQINSCINQLKIKKSRLHLV